MKHAIVTRHALRRYLEQVKGLVAEGDDTQALRALVEQGADIDAAYAEITVIVLPAVQVGAKAVRSGSARFVLDGAKVVSVVPIAKNFAAFAKQTPAPVRRRPVWAHRRKNFKWA